MERGFKPRGFKTSGYKNLARSARNRVWNELCLFYGTITWNVVRRFQRPPEEETPFETTCYGLYFTHHMTHFKLQSMLELSMYCFVLFHTERNHTYNVNWFGWIPWLYIFRFSALVLGLWAIFWRLLKSNSALRIQCWDLLLQCGLKQINELKLKPIV